MTARNEHSAGRERETADAGTGTSGSPELIALAAQGLSHSAIADRLGVSQTTVSRAVRLEAGASGPAGRRPVKVPELEDATWLRERVVQQRMSQTEIASALGVHRTTVRSALVRHGLTTRARRKPRAGLDDPSWLREHYENRLMSQSEIGRLLGVDMKTVGLALRRTGIAITPRPPLPPELGDKQWLAERYCTDKLSLAAIARLLDVSSSTVKRAVAAHNISRSDQR